MEAEGSPHAWEDVGGEVLAEIEARVTPLVRKLADDLYGDILYSVQDYLIDNTKFNIAGRIGAADRQARCDRERAFKAEAQRDELLAALKALNECILGKAESNASGNPEWEYVRDRVNAARAAISKAEAS